MRRLSWGDHVILDTLNPAEELVSTLRESDPSWPYALARAYEARGLVESARVVFRLEVESGHTPWNGRSAYRLSRQAAQEQRWLVAEGYGRRGVDLLPDSRDLWFRYGQALYRGGRYEDLLDLTDRIPFFTGDDRQWDGSAAGSGTETTIHDLHAEFLLWRAVSAFHLNRQQSDRFLEAFTQVPAQSIHSRLYLFLFYRDGALAGFTTPERRLLEAVYRGSIAENAEARRLFRLLEPAYVAGFLSERNGERPALLSTIEHIAGTGDAAMEQWLRDLQTEPAVEALVPDILFILGRYAEARGDRALALEYTADAVDQGRTSHIRDWVQIAIRSAMPLPEVIERLNRWEAEPEEYALATDRLLPVMIREQQWAHVEDVYAALPVGARDARAHLAVVTALLDRDGLQSISDVPARLEEAAALSPVSYYGLLARHLMGRGTPAFESAPEEEQAELRTEETRYTAALLVAGLHDTARLRSMSVALDPEQAEPSLALARQFHHLGHASAALDLARRAIARGNLAVGRDEIPILYPLPFRTEITVAAEDYGIHPAVLFGLIREESHFNPSARSPVGASGLAQVMPATAEDLVRRMGLASVDLESVSDSVRMGAFYLRYLAEQLPDQLILQLAAYNAGLGRGRTWNGQFGALSRELQIEALPFIETRWYLRRIAVSSAWYQHRLSATDPSEVLPLFVGD